MTSPSCFDRLRHPWMQALVTAALYAAITCVGIRLLRTAETIGIIWRAIGVLVGAVRAWRETRPWLLGGACWLACGAPVLLMTRAGCGR